MAGRLLHGKVSAPTERLVTEAAAATWATPGELSDALEQLAVEALTIAAQNADELDDLEDDLFRFGRLVSGAAGPAVRPDRAPPAPTRRRACSPACCRTRSARCR